MKLKHQSQLEQKVIMKKFFYLMMAMVIALSVFTSCKSNDKEEIAVQKSEYATSVNYFNWKAGSIVNDNLLVLDSYARGESYVKLKDYAELIVMLPVGITSSNAEGEYGVLSCLLTTVKGGNPWYQLKEIKGEDFHGHVSIKGKNPYDIKVDLYNIEDQYGGYIEKASFEYHGDLEDISMLEY